MRDIVATLQHIADLQPETLSPLSLPASPDFHAALPLCEMIAAGSPGGATLVETARAVNADRRLVSDINEVAAGHVEVTRTELLHLAGELGGRAVQILPRLLSPVPGAQAGALLELQNLAGIFTRTATARVLELEQVLDPLADDLDRVAGTAHTAALPSPAPPDPPAPEGPQESGHESASSGGTGEAAVAAALSQVGTPYVWGGTGEGGFDCSGLTQWAWRQAGVELPRLAEQQTVGTQVSAEELIPGDLVVWDGHVAMYAGGGQIVEAGDPVQTNPLRTSNMGMAFKGFWRPTG